MDELEISKSNKSCIANPKSEIADWTRSSLRFRDFGFAMQCGVNPKSETRVYEKIDECVTTEVHEKED